jgi:zinc/manganese transport system substrate-binding protein
MSSRRTRSVLAAASVLTVLALGVTACSTSDGQAAATGGAGDKIKVVASTDVWGSVLSAVGGDKVQVTSIIHDPKADPHSYESTAEDGLAVQDAKVLLGNGGGYDDFFTKLSDQAPGAKKLVAYDIAGTGNENEHVWYSLPSVEKVADQVAAQLGQVQPASQKLFTDNATAFKTKVESLLRTVTQIGVAHPGEKVIATEPIAFYLLGAAKVTDATPKEFSNAVEQETDIPVAAVDQVKQLISGKQVNAVVNNAQTTTTITDQIIANAKTAGIPVVDVTETFPDGATDYIGWMTKEVDALSGALSS